MTTTRPVPVPDEITRPYWEAADAQRLAIQRCGACREFVHPPMVTCPSCRSTDLGFEDVSGRGTVYSHTTIADSQIESFRDRVPYVVALVELQEQAGLLLLTNIVDADPADVGIGFPVEVEFEEIEPGRWLPQFRLLPVVAER